MDKNRYYVMVLILVVLIFSGQIIYSQRYVIVHLSPENHKYQTEYSQLEENSGSEGMDELYKKAEKYLKENNSSANYFRIDKSGRSLWNGKHWTPVDYPLGIYIKTAKSKYYKNMFRGYVEYAMSIWENADPRIKFEYVSNTNNADIVIIFEENLIYKYDDNYLGITDYNLEDNKKISKSYIEIGLLKFNNEPVSDGEVKATIIHELGHALGLGHSENENDIMFPFINPFSSSEMHFDELSGSDIAAVKSVVSLGFRRIMN